MGYHGFGMRKEVYTRKPKKAFGKVKKHIEKNPYKLPTKKIEREVYIHTYHKPAYKRWWFIVMALGIIGYFGYMALTDIILPDLAEKQAFEALKQQRLDFENDGLLDYFLEHRSAADSAFALMIRSDRALFNISTENQSTFIRIQSRRKLKDLTRYSRNIYPDTYDRFYVENDLLMNGYRDYPPIADRAWKLTIELNENLEIPATYFEHMQLSANDLTPIIRRSKENEWVFQKNASGFQWSFREYEKAYTIYFNNKPWEMTGVRKKNFQELSPGVYWYRH